MYVICSLSGKYDSDHTVVHLLTVTDWVLHGQHQLARHVVGSDSVEENHLLPARQQV